MFRDCFWNIEFGMPTDLPLRGGDGIICWPDLRMGAGDGLLRNLVYTIQPTLGVADFKGTVARS